MRGGLQQIDGECERKLQVIHISRSGDLLVEFCVLHFGAIQP